MSDEALLLALHLGGLDGFTSVHQRRARFSQTGHRI